MLALRNVTKTYGSTKVLNGVSLDIPPKENICITGEGGSGKSTLVKLLVRAEDPTSGTVQVDGIDLKSVPPAILQLYRRRLGIAFQEPMLLMHATVAENIALPLELFGTPESVVKRATDDLMKRLDLTAKADRLATDLSVSEKSLVGLARAIITAPMILIADEPLLHLDEHQAETVTQLLKNMHRHGTTLILFSGDPDTGDAFGSRALRLESGKISGASASRRHTKTADTHRILEETEQPQEPAAAPEHKPHTPPKQADGSKKIRITSIGSGL